MRARGNAPGLQPGRGLSPDRETGSVVPGEKGNKGGDARFPIRAGPPRVLIPD
jgi:hypothetical protein